MSRLARVVLALALLPAPVIAQSALPIGSTAVGTLGANGEAARYRFQATGPGVLTVVAHGAEDLTLAVMDEDGQPVADGTADRDLNGNAGSEVLAVVLTAGGTYLVEVRSHGSSGGSFTVGGGWLAMPAFARPPDPDGRPSQAGRLTVGATHTDALHPDEGDQWDWYTLTVAERTTLVVVTRVDEGVEGDLALEVYLDNDYSTPAVQSDQDLQGNLGNESVTVDVRAGQPVHIKVRSFSTSGGAVPYRVSVTRVP
ncbi:MAG: hypothetical protein ABR551_02015 [Gemmatimonadales bacterium]